jgi:hypothetical protein
VEDGYGRKQSGKRRRDGLYFFFGLLVSSLVHGMLILVASDNTAKAVIGGPTRHEYWSQSYKWSENVMEWVVSV